MQSQENRIKLRNIQEAIKTENLRLFDKNGDNIIKKTELYKKKKKTQKSSGKARDT